MRHIAYILIAIIALAALFGIIRREELGRLMAVQTLFDEDRIVSNFSNMDELFKTVPMSRGDGPVSPLPEGEPIDLPPRASEWIEDRAVTALVVLSEGEIVYEDYFLGTDADDRRISWSVAKSWLSALLGIVIDEGAIDSMDDPVTKYVPELAGTAYDGATIRNVANMASGVEFDEDYLDFWSDINRMGRVIALGGSLDDFTLDLEDSRTAPGEEWYYVSMDTHVLGMVIRAATGERIPPLLEDKIVQPLGLEADPYYLSDGDGNAFVLGGLNMPTRDYARFGQMIAQGGMWQGQQIVPSDWIDRSTEATAPAGESPADTGYGFQWWLPANARAGEVFAIGVYGQYIWIDREQNVVIAMNSANRDFTRDGVMADNIAMLRAITEKAHEARTD
ncbi:serine hydrolase [Maritimibacter sp. UBA3975]|uniref:serine hydrolase domain-containing protein n=1 Tax=Maritimibacter sp. UBA3975 TaxID=1946833 RepID=UPI000C0A0D19|nr:serine hydrolase [Maritimibacter sp. UBA3975]MAM60382.1 6-aminohexanoate hydrolase [Maritimibacter sp.]